MTTYDSKTNKRDEGPRDQVRRDQGTWNHGTWSQGTKAQGTSDLLEDLDPGTCETKRHGTKEERDNGHGT